MDSQRGRKRIIARFDREKLRMRYWQFELVDTCRERISQRVCVRLIQYLFNGVEKLKGLTCYS